MSFLRNKIGLAALMIAAGMMLVPVSAQAACNGGGCPLTGGTLRMMVGGGFIIPQVPSVFPFTGPGQFGNANQLRVNVGISLGLGQR